MSLDYVDTNVASLAAGDVLKLAGRHVGVERVAREQGTNRVHVFLTDGTERIWDRDAGATVLASGIQVNP